MRMIAARRVLLLILVCAATLYAAGAVVFWLQPDTALRGRADAVVVLAGSKTRLPVAVRLMESDVAGVLVVSADDSGRDPARAAFCAAASSASYDVVCRAPRPFSTQGEARTVAAIAAKRNWGSIVIVTSRFHLFRARLLFRRCTDAAIVLRGAPEPWWRAFSSIPLEWAKLALAETLRRGC